MDTSNLRKPSETGLRRPTILVVGASGILRPAASSLLAAGTDVIAVGRESDRLGDLDASTRGLRTSAALHVVAADASRPTFPAVVRRLLDSRRLRLDGAIVYAPASAPDVIEACVTAMGCAFVEVLTSQAAEPRSTDHQWSVADLPPIEGCQRSRRRRLVLGWQRRDRVPRWHNSEEISAAAVAALVLPGDRVLGSVTPWHDRPE